MANSSFYRHIILLFQEYLFERKVKATDRTKTPEEIAKEEADKLHADEMEMDAWDKEMKVRAYC